MMVGEDETKELLRPPSEHFVCSHSRSISRWKFFKSNGGMTEVLSVLSQVRSPMTAKVILPKEQNGEMEQSNRSSLEWK